MSQTNILTEVKERIRKLEKELLFSVPYDNWSIGTFQRGDARGQKPYLGGKYETARRE